MKSTIDLVTNEILDIPTTNRVEKRGNKWCVVHGHPKKPGSKTDKPEGSIIKCFPTKAEADAMHKAIMANNEEGDEEMVTLFSNVTLNLKTDKAKTRYETLEGKQYLVVPCVMMTEGVHEGTQGPLYYPANELSKIPAIWNTKPVVVYHPQMNGISLSACDPVILEKQRIGILMNTKWVDGKLKTECWIDEEKTKLVDERVLDAIQSGQMMEVSTGLFTENEDTEGEWNGEVYKSIARNYKPDHLAILPDLKGACSIEDGAGLLRNENISREFSEIMVALARGEGQGQGGPKQGDGGTDTCICPKCGASASHERGIPCTSQTCPKCGSKMIGEGSVKNAIRAFQSSLQNEISHEDVRSKLQNKIEEDAWIVDIWDTFFIYDIGGKYYYQKYEGEDDDIKLIGMRKEATKVIQYQLIDGELIGNFLQSQEDCDMDKKKVIDELIANEKSPWTEEQRKMLMEMSEDQLGWMTSNEADENPKKIEEPAKKEKVETKTENPKKVEEPAVNEEATVEEYIANAPEGMRDVLLSGIKAHQDQKTALIQKITANERNPFSEEQLKAKGLDELKALAILAEVPAEKPKVPSAPSFFGQSEVVTDNQNHEEEPLPIPTMNFEKSE